MVFYNFFHVFVVCMHAVYVCAHVYNSGGLRLISVTFLSHSAMLLFDSEFQSACSSLIQLVLLARLL